MKVIKDSANCIHLIDNYNPYNSIVFDVHKESVAVYPDSADPRTRERFEAIDEAAEFSKDDLILGLNLVINILRREV